LFIIISLIFSSCKKEIKGDYYCPMHPEYTSNRAGTCPICNMNLVKKEKKEEHKDHNHNSEKDINRKEHPDHKNMNMNNSEKEDHSGHDNMDMKNSNSEENQNSNKITISTEKQKLIGIETSKVIYKEFNKQLRFPATVTYDPELYASLVEYREIAGQTRLEGMKEHSSGLMYSAYNRLKQMGLNKDTINFWMRRDLSELISGGRNVSHLYAQIYEAEIGSITKGMEVKVSSNTYPDKIFIGKVISLDTILDSATRTLRARIMVNDPGNLLKPQMIAEVEFSLKSQNVLSVPSVAIMHTGLRSIVYRKTGKDEFEQIEILAGKESDEYTEVSKGLKEGDEVVTKANFLVDSESKLRLGRKGAHNHDN
ncbi:MAG: efflux RND transporter periplasmic adaptor subunit, partial [Leptospiraceae bacterium]|nr:efflux RND transporter periplasmic adaptor subunit [Leptospiraceae bacterium]